MTQLTREGLVVARRPGTRLFLATGVKSPPAFQGPSERTIFFRNESAEAELRAMRVPPESVELVGAKLSAEIG
jgi:hypothetical protein